jgi:hypothetical protein
MASRAPDPVTGFLTAARAVRFATAAVLILAACTPTLNPSRSPATSPTSLPTSSASSSPTAPPMSISCQPEAAPAPALQGDPCPGAISAVELAVAPVRLPIERMVLEPGPFYCDVIWPGATTAPACFGTLVIPGQYMHAWVRFVRSDEVAAVMLGRDLPADLTVPAPTLLPWNATLVAVEVPPTGWVMP